MIDLRLKLDDIDFARLFELGRSVIPSVAPSWTDHNTHDPGIMLTELVAWIADAQVYSLARLRRDERIAYARLIGLERRGPAAAKGLIWPVTSANGASWPAGTVVKSGTEVMAPVEEIPGFVVSETLELTTATLTAVSSVSGGVEHDWTNTVARPGATFKPFGDVPLPGDRLLLEFGGPFATTPDALISLGFDVVSDGDTAGYTAGPARRLRAFIIDVDGERPLAFGSDTTNGLLRSGVVLLRVPEGIRSRHKKYRVALEANRGRLLRSPTLRRVAVNVVPIEQVTRETDEDDAFGKGLPDQTHEFKRATLVRLADSIKVELAGKPWEIVRDFSDSDPDSPHVVLDLEKAVLRFGNGINGRMAPERTALRVEYSVCAGASGNAAAGVPWRIRGLSDVFGVNIDTIAGGADPDQLADLRRIARERLRSRRPIVTSSDLVQAAQSFSDLGVRRAVELTPPAKRRPVRGSRVLLVVGPRDPDGTVSGTIETKEWLEEVRARLAPRLPIGERLVVIAPRDVDVRLTASLVAARNADPKAIKHLAEKKLREIFATVGREPGGSVWPFGRDVSLLAVKGVLRRLPGVARVSDVSLTGANGIPTTEIVIGSTGLPRMLLNSTSVVVTRGGGEAR